MLGSPAISKLSVFCVVGGSLQGTIVAGPQELLSHDQGCLGIRIQDLNVIKDFSRALAGSNDSHTIRSGGIQENLGNHVGIAGGVDYPWVSLRQALWN